MFIDIHHHINPPNAPAPVGTPPWSPKIAIEEMEQNGIATGIGFLGPIAGNDIEGDRRRARQWNEFGAQLCCDHGRHFGLFAALPLSDVEGSLDEMEYALGSLKADGLGIVTNYGDKWLGDSHFEPIWQEANRRKAIIFVHPTDAPCCTPAKLSYQKPPVSGPWIEWPMNTARTILSLMLSGTLRKYADLRFIFCHGGGVMPLLIGRVSEFTAWGAVGPEKLRALFPDGIETEFRRLRFECAQAYSEVNFGALTKLVPTANIMFGTDYNRFPIAHSVRQFGRLGLDAKTAAAIAHQNAEKLFPRLQSKALSSLQRPHTG